MIFCNFAEKIICEVMKGFLYTPLISLLFLTFASCKEVFFTQDGEIWGTTYHIVYEHEARLDRNIDSVLHYVDSELSMFNPASSLSAINAGSTDSVSRTFEEVFDIAASVSRISGGVYDPTVGPLTELWGFGNSDCNTLPTTEEIAKALSTVGIGDCRVADGHIIKKDSATVFDFSSVAKGYGIDMVCRMLEDEGVRNYLVEIGGEVRTLGYNPKGNDWHIQIDMPQHSLLHRRLAVVSFDRNGKSMASSGNYRNFRKRADGSIYGHTISPLTGLPVEGEVIAATVIATECAAADALATACMATAQAEAADSIIKAWPGAEALFVVAADDSATIVTTPGFEEYLTSIHPI